MDIDKVKLTTREIKSLSEKSIWPWVMNASVDWLVIATSFICFSIWCNLFTLIFLVLIIGNRQHALTILGHDASHYAVSRNRNLNDYISDIATFWSLGITTSGYRRVHNRHHNYTNMEQDPELAHRYSRAPQWDLPIKLPRILKYCFSDLLGFAYKDYLIIVKFSCPNKPTEYTLLVLFHILLNGLFLLSGLWWVPLIWYVSLFTSFMMFFRLRTFLEHLGTEDTHKIYLNWLERQIIAPHNIWYHCEHHSYPTIPYYKLPKVRNLLKKGSIMSLKNLLNFYSESKPMLSGEVIKKG